MLRKNSTLHRILTNSEVDFLTAAVESISRLLPHYEEPEWQEIPGASKAGAVFTTPERRYIEIRIPLGDGESIAGKTLTASIARRTTKVHVNTNVKTAAMDEKDICDRIAKQITDTISASRKLRKTDTQTESTISHFADDMLIAMLDTLDDLVVAHHVSKHRTNASVLPRLLAELRNLSWRTYENKSHAFGVIVTHSSEEPEDGCSFTSDFLDERTKRYRALSDGFHTAYEITGAGKLTRYISLPPDTPSAKCWYPSWTAPIASASRDAACGVCLTRQGEILVFQRGTLRFSFRFGRWQYWNHGHIVHALELLCRTQHVEIDQIRKVVKATYRAALNISFRRSGGLFVILKNQKNIEELVRDADVVDGPKRLELDSEFDDALGSRSIVELPLETVVELASLDGAVVMTAKGSIVAYAAILDPSRKGKLSGTEGSRTRTAIGASHYGIALKVSADGGMAVYHDGQEVLRV